MVLRESVARAHGRGSGHGAWARPPEQDRTTAPLSCPLNAPQQCPQDHTVALDIVKKPFKPGVSGTLLPQLSVVEVKSFKMSLKSRGEGHPVLKPLGPALEETPL